MAQDELAAKTIKALARPRRLTLAALWLERILQAFWPAFSLLCATYALLSFGLGQRFVLWSMAVAVVLAVLWGLRAFRAPRRSEALARMDASLQGAPIAALQDSQALGGDDPQTQALWHAHLARMAAKAAKAKAIGPNPQIHRRDPYGLRLMALTGAAMAALFGQPILGHTPQTQGLGTADSDPSAPPWEAWAKPPAYTGKPVLYLNDTPEGEIVLPLGSEIQLRHYGQTALAIEQSLSQTAPLTQGQITQLVVDQSGHLQIKGQNGRSWDIYAMPDFAPTIETSAEISREAGGRFKQPYSASDDYAVAKAGAEFSLNLGAVQRLHGLKLPPEDLAPLKLDLPLPIRGKRDAIEAAFSEDLSQSLYANMPVIMVLNAQDGRSQIGTSEGYALTLPAKRFFDPMAAAVAEMRRDILWNRENAPRAAEILRAMMHRPDDLTRSQGAAKRLRVTLRELEAAVQNGPLDDASRDQITAELWTIALKFEEGDLGSAYEQLARAQDRLEEAIRNGADPTEIDQLMKELQKAMRDYTRELAKNATPAPAESDAQGQEITSDQLQQMLDEIERLMKEGKTAEAMALMEQLRQLMENLQVQQGQGQGEGEGEGSGQGPMGDLGETLKQQQQLSDDAYRDLQRGRSGEQTEGGQAEGGRGLAQRQQELNEKLDQLQGQRLPGDGHEAGEAGREALDQAGEAMKRAQEALEDGNLSEALRNQAQAMQAMREGMSHFGRAQSGNRPGPADPDGKGQPDPLGRSGEGSARIGSDNNMVQENPDQRAQSLLDEIRRRSGQAERPKLELDYLKRLLDIF